MWIAKKNGYKYVQERVYDETTGKTRLVSARIKIDSPAGEKDAINRVSLKIGKMQNTDFLLSEVVEKYLADQERVVKTSTYRKTESILRSFLSIAGDCYTDHLSAGIIRNKLIESGKSPRTCNEYIKRLKSLLKWAYVNDYISTNSVSEKLILFPDTTQKERIKDKYLEREELNRVLGAMQNTRYRLATQFLALSGLRIGEFIALNKFDVNLGTISVNKTYDIASGNITTPKTLCSIREVAIQDELEKVINDIKEFLHKEKAEIGYPANEIFFCSGNGERFNYQAYLEYFEKIVLSVTGRKLSVHALRHTHTSLLAESGVPIDVISRRLGHEHSDITTQVYLHLTDNQKEKDAETIKSIRIIG